MSGVQPPLPLLPATVTVTCTTGAGSARASRHPVTIGVGWQVDTGHDMLAEMVAAALGGRVSCLDLPDRVVPAVREWVGLRLRRHPLRLIRDGSRRWLLAESASCCRARGWTTPGVAAEHGREATHVATRFGASAPAVAEIADRLSVPTPHRPADPWLAQLWQCGLDPEVARAFHEQVAPLHGMLPEDVVVLLASPLPHGPGSTTWSGTPIPPLMHWVGEAAAHVAGLPDRTEWARLQAPAREVCELTGAGYRARQVARVCRAARVSGPAAVTMLAGWVRAGSRPSVAELIRALDTDTGTAPSPD